MCDMFGGSSAAENAGLAQEQGLASTFSADMAQQYQQQQATNTQLQSEIGRLQTGTTGPGFGGAENEAYISGIQNNAAAASRNATQAARTVGAGTQTAPTGGMTRQSGINAQQAGNIAAVVGANEANQLGQETEMNYATGRQNAITTAQALQTMSNSFNPLGYGNAASSANSSAFSEADTINQQNIARAQAIAGTIESGIGMAATGGIGGLAGMGGMGGGIGGFLKAGANSLGANFQAPAAGGGGINYSGTSNLPQMQLPPDFSSWNSGGSSNNYFG
jgi:hypothetical protein